MTNIIDSGEVIDHGAETVRMHLPEDTIVLDAGDRTMLLAPYVMNPPPRRPDVPVTERLYVPQHAARDADLDLDLDGFDPGGYPPVPRPTPPPPPPAPGVWEWTAQRHRAAPVPAWELFLYRHRRWLIAVGVLLIASAALAILGVYLLAYVAGPAVTR